MVADEGEHGSSVGRIATLAGLPGGEFDRLVERRGLRDQYIVARQVCEVVQVGGAVMVDDYRAGFKGRHLCLLYTSDAADE